MVWNKNCVIDHVRRQPEAGTEINMRPASASADHPGPSLRVFSQALKQLEDELRRVFNVLNTHVLPND